MLRAAAFTCLGLRTRTRLCRFWPGSRATLVYGDAAAAWVIERKPRDVRAPATQLIDFEVISDGAYHDIMSIDAQGYVETRVPQQQLNTLASESFAKASRRLLDRN